MTAEHPAEVLRRLDDLLAGRSPVTEEVFPRLVTTLVRRAGSDGEQLLGLQVVREADGRKAAALIRASVQALGERAVPFLLQGALSRPDLSRGLATIEVLGHLGTPAARAALAEIERRSSQPVVRTTAGTQRRRLEEGQPVRYSLLPRLLAPTLSEAEARDLEGELATCPDPALCPLLIEAWPTLGAPARRTVLRTLETRGGPEAAAFLQDHLGEAGELLGPWCAAAEAVLRRYPAETRGDQAWSELYLTHAADPEVATAAARVLARAPGVASPGLLPRFLASAVEEVRRAGLEAVVDRPWPGAREAVEACLDSPADSERAAALTALHRLGDASALAVWATDPDPWRRASAALACLRCREPALWAGLASDPDPRVAQAALEALTGADPGQRPRGRALEEVLHATGIPLVFRAVCEALVPGEGSVGTAAALAATLTGPPWKRGPALGALGELRRAGAYTWEALPPEARREIEDAIAGGLPGSAEIQVAAALTTDLGEEPLVRFRDALQGHVSWGGGKPGAGKGAAEALFAAITGRLHVLQGSRQVAEEIEGSLGAGDGTPNALAQRVQTVARGWLRPGVTLAPDLGSRIEAFLAGVALDRAAPVLVRRDAVAALGQKAGLAALPLLVPLRRHPTAAIADAAQAAVEALARRHPGENPSRAVAVSPDGAPCLLVVEDEESTRTLYERFLFQKGFQTWGVADGVEALAALERYAVELVLLDLQLPRLDGLGFLEAIKDRPQRPRVAVITGQSDRAVVARCAQLGVAEFLRKPVDLEELLRRVHRLLGR